MGSGKNFKKKEENMLAALKLPKVMEVPAVTHFKSIRQNL